MHTNISTRILEKIADEDLAIFDRYRRTPRGVEDLLVNLGETTDDRIVALRDAFERLRHYGVRGVGALINDIDIWRSVVVDGGAGQQRPRTLRQFGDLATEYLRPAPRHWMYGQGRNANEWLAHYVNYVDYRPPERTGGANYTAGSVTISTLYWRMGTRTSADFTFRNDDTDQT